MHVDWRHHEPWASKTRTKEREVYFFRYGAEKHKFQILYRILALYIWFISVSLSSACDYFSVVCLCVYFFFLFFSFQCKEIVFFLLFKLHFVKGYHRRVCTGLCTAVPLHEYVTKQNTCSICERFGFENGCGRNFPQRLFRHFFFRFFSLLFFI